MSLPLLFVITILIRVKDGASIRGPSPGGTLSPPSETTHAIFFRDLGLWKGMALEAADLGSGSDSTT